MKKKIIIGVFAGILLLTACNKKQFYSTSSDTSSSTSPITCTTPITTTVAQSTKPTAVPTIIPTISPTKVIPTTAPAQTRKLDLFFTEYYEGASQDRYIEIMNATGSDLDTTGYCINLYSNGSKDVQASLALNRIIKDGQIITICSPNAVTALKSKADLIDKICNYNGDDILTIEKDGNIIDIIGSWSGMDQNVFKDHTLIRKSSINGPIKQFDINEWNVINISDESMGKHTIDGYVNPFVEDEIEEPIENERIPDLFISEYSVGSSGTHYLEIYNEFDYDISLEQYKLALYKNGATTPSSVYDLNGVISAKSVYIVSSTWAQGIVGQMADIKNDIAYFSGKHVVALLKNDEIIDIIGKLGVVPDKGFEIDEYYTTDNNTIIRDKTVTSPTNVFNPNEWISCGADYYYDIGSHKNLYYTKDTVFDDLETVFDLIKTLKLNDKGTAYSDDYINVEATVLFDVAEETSITYVTDGKKIIKLHGDKIHNKTVEGNKYIITCKYSSWIYQPELEFDENSSLISLGANQIDDLDAYEIDVPYITDSKRESLSENIDYGVYGDILAVTGYLVLDTHNSTHYDWCLIDDISTKNVKNKTGYINNAIYFKNDYDSLDLFDLEGQIVTIYLATYEYNTNRANWLVYFVDIDE